MSGELIGSVVGIAGGLKSLFGGSGGGSAPSGQQAQQMADPFAKYRGALGEQYAGMLTPGKNVDPKSLPGYSQWETGVLNPALEKTASRGASMGRYGSGQEAQDLLGVAQQGYYGFMTDYMNRLAQGSGAVNNPAQAAGMGLQQGQANNQGFMQGVGGVVQGAAGIYNNWPGGGGGAPGGGVSSAWDNAGSTQGSDSHFYRGGGGGDNIDAGGGWTP